MGKTKNKFILTILFTVIGTLVGALSATLTWFAKMNGADLYIGGSVLSQYFDSGTGAEDDPFIITRPKHWENLVWLHNNVSTFYQAIDDGTGEDATKEKGYYFQVGKLNEELDDGVLYVYDYADNGMINSSNTKLTSRVLNLKGLDSLIPIGSCTKPFMGEIVSDGISISGFDVLGFEDLNSNLEQDTNEKGFNDVGIFGYVGRNSFINGLYFENFKIHLANSEADRPNGDTVVHATGYHDKDHDGVLDSIYVGYIAGHIHYSTTLQEVYINNCSMTGGSAATSGFGYFGMVENEDGNIKPTPLEEIAAIKQSGDGNSFGGSIDMYNVFDRLSEIVRDHKNDSHRFVSAETVVIDPNSDKKNIVTQQLTNVSTSYNGYNYYYYSSQTGGSVNITADNSYSKGASQGTGNIYECLYGESSKFTKTVTTYTLLDDWYDCFFISNGSNYLNYRYESTVQNVTNEEQAAGWNFDGSGHLYTKVLNEIYYLNRDNYALTMSTTADTVWAQTGDNEIYTVINGNNCYLDYDNGWYISPVRDVYLISDNNGNYFSANSSTVTNTTNENDATKWILSNPNGDSSIAILNRDTGTFNYLTNSADSLGFSTTEKIWAKDGNYYYITLQGIRYYIVFEGGQWYLRPEDGVRISDGNGNYLSASASAINNQILVNGSTIWHYSSATGDTQIFHIYNGNKYFLTVNNGNLTVSTSAATWHRTGDSLYFTSGTTDYYLTYSANAWKVVSLEYYLIHDSGSNYLVANGTNFTNTTNSANATHFYFSNMSGTHPTGTISYTYNNTVYNLYVNVGTVTNGILNGSTTNSTNWSNDGNSIYYTNGNYTYYLECNSSNTWAIRTYINGYYITDGTNYMTVSGSTIGNTTNQNNATVFLFSNTGSNPSGTITAAGTNYKLRVNSNNLQSSTSTGTNWSNNGNNLYNGSNYIVFNSGWVLANSISGSGYYISKNGYYLCSDGSTVYTSSTPDTLWSGTSGNIKVAGSTNDYLAIDTKGSQYTLGLATSGKSWITSNDNLYYQARDWFTNYTYYITFSNNTFGAGRKTNTTFDDTNALTFQQESYDYTGTSKVMKSVNNIRNTISALMYAPSPTVTSTNYTPTKNMSVGSAISNDYNMSLTGTQLQNMEKSIQSGVRSGNASYFPLRVDQDEDGNYAADYAASPKNTGYIISGANIEESTNSSDTDFQKGHGDIRIGGWPKSNISGSYNTNNNSFTTIYTIDDSSSNRARELTNSEKENADYQHALEEFGKTLAASSKVFGLHFMNSMISKEHTVRAPQATILGQTYYNYELPEDSIDFNVYQRGQVSFFSGEYFTDNNAFFSLNRVFRDAKNDISEIKEIKEIYWHAQRHDKANYIYKFDDNTYTNPNGTYTSATSLDGSYSATPIFKTSWITTPDGLSTNSKRLYYFSIPCNAGEYALGSVSGRTGAYISYLDIGANGGDSILENIQTSDTASTFDVDFRSPTEVTDHSVLQLGVELPNTVNPSDLEITVSFDNSPETCEGTAYSAGLYVIHVKNTTGVTIEVSVLVIDDDDDLYNDFNYGYKIIYTNEDYTNTVINGLALNADESGYESVDYWKRLAIFVIPSTGEAGESSYE